MFYVIDTWLIGNFQWVMRQLELYTSLTRKALLSVLFLAVVCVITVRTCAGIQLTQTFNFLGLLAGWLVINWSLCGVANFLSLYIPARNIEPKVAAVMFIEKRYGHRIMCTCIVLLCTPFIFWWADTPIRDTQDYLLKVCVELVAAEFFFFFLLEYFLCTLSIPPEEKERRKAEKELRNKSFGHA